ncbi:unnamed protein product [Rodentolepis nana]|uniref:ANK_REP_REGION domain-containing protein n=1 Tax=Rodentolepis nana TaxID=102285 RepID=A0A0R3T224_RODNA|nr:unnamed protein product [Rodentolepis nana]
MANNKEALHNFGSSSLTLSAAIESGDADALRDLLKAGRSPDEYEWDAGTTPLIQATEKRNLEAMRILLKYRATISKKHKDGYTAIHVASVIGFLKGLELLSSYGGDLTEPDKDNLTPLVLAASEGHVNVVHYLFHISRSSNSPCSSSPVTPLVIAAIRNKIDVVEFLLHAEDKSAYSLSELNQALLQATILGHEEVVRALLEHTADPNYKQDLPPIHAAIQKGHHNILLLLCNHDANFEIRDKRGFTPLMTACFERNLPAVKYLLEIGANVKASARNGKYTPLKIARRAKVPEIVQLIESALETKF